MWGVAPLPRGTTFQMFATFLHLLLFLLSLTALLQPSITLIRLPPAWVFNILKLNRLWKKKKLQIRL